jgi:hypothetical protein
MGSKTSNLLHSFSKFLQGSKSASKNPPKVKTCTSNKHKTSRSLSMHTSNQTSNHATHMCGPITCWKTIGSEERLRIQKHIDHTSMWTMLGVRYPTLLQPCSLFPSMYHHIHKPYGITISLPPYSNMLVVLTYFQATYVFDCLQHLSTTLFLISTTPLSMFHLHHNLQHKETFDFVFFLHLNHENTFFSKIFLKLCVISVWES